MKHNLVCGVLTLGLSALLMTGQWLNYPTPGIPRTADGKPNLSAATPRTADGKPDLSGLWTYDLPPIPNGPEVDQQRFQLNLEDIVVLLWVIKIS